MNIIDMNLMAVRSHAVDVWKVANSCIFVNHVGKKWAPSPVLTLGKVSKVDRSRVCTFLPNQRIEQVKFY